MRVAIALPSALLAAACGEVPVEDGFKGEITLEQASSKIANTGTSCHNETTKVVGETSYFRAFRLADHDIRGPFKVTALHFSVSERAAGGTATRFPIELSIHDYTGETGGDTLDTTQLTLKKSTMVDIVEEDVETFLQVDYTQPLVVDIEAEAFVFRIHIDNFSAQMHKFFLATTDQGETQPSYAACADNAPSTLTGLGFTAHSLLMSVTGEAL